MAGPGDFADVSSRVLADLRERVGLEGWSLSRRDGDEQVVLSAVDDVFGMVPGNRYPWADSFDAQLVDHGAPMVADDVDTVEPYARARRRNGIPARACLVVPVRSPDGDDLGVLCALARRPVRTIDAHLVTVQVQAEVLGALLAHELRRVQEMRRIERDESAVHRDPLTGLGTRRSWDVALRAEEGRAARYASGAAVLVVTLDDLSEVNAEPGHQAGDRLLVHAADLLAGRMRADDVLARVGGDDFAMILPGTGLTGAEAVAADLRGLLSRAGIRASIGVARRTGEGGMLAAWRAAEAVKTSAPPAPSPEPGVESRRPSGSGTASGQGPAGLDKIDALLQLVKDQLGMDVAFLNTFEGENRQIRNLVSSVDLPFVAGYTEPSEGSYCQLIGEGRMDEVTPDTSQNPLVRDLPTTHRMGIGSYIGIPLHRSDGSIYGTLCAFSRSADASLRTRDTGTLRAVAGIVMSLAEAEDRDKKSLHTSLRRLDLLYAGGGPNIVYQPIMTLDRLRPVGTEALSRFPEGTPPDQWFAAAAAAGVGTRLELSALRNATVALPRLKGFLALNASATTIISPGFAELVAALPLDRIALEITEHEEVDNYDILSRVLEPLRDNGLRVSVDDAGAGFASMRHILALLPDFIKLDISLVRGIDSDEPRQALAAALAAFAFKTSATVIAEGIETQSELECLRTLGIDYGQGYYLGRPAPLVIAPR